jgi:AcrR family transcriptional regulator
MDKRDTKQEILHTASILFFNDGYHVGIDRIIKESRVAKMTFYKHFPAKTDLLVAVISGTYRRIDRVFRKMAEDQTQTPLQQAINTFDFLCDSMRDPEYLGALIPRALAELSDPDDMARKVAQFDTWQTYCAIRRACLKAGTKGGPMVGRQIHMLITGGNLLCTIFDDEPSIQAAKAGIRNVLNLARPPA